MRGSEVREARVGEVGKMREDEVKKEIVGGNVSRNYGGEVEEVSESKGSMGNY